MLKNILKTLCLLGFVATAHAQSVTDYQRNDNAATTLQNTNLGRMPQASTSFGRAFNNADKYVAGNLDMTDTNSAVSILADGYTSVTIRYTRTAQTGSILPQTSVDGVTWANAYYYVTTAGSTTISPTVSSNNITFAGQEVLKVPCEGALYVRILVFGAGTGSLPVTLIAKNGLIYTAINNILPGTAAANLGKAEDSVHASGDTGVFGLGVANTNATTLAAEGDYVGGAHGTNGAYLVDLKRSLQVSDAGSLLKAEDAAAGSGDTGAFVLGVRRAAPGAVAGTGDYAPFITSDDTGGQFVELSAGALTTNPIRLEDAPFAGASAVAVGGTVRQDTLTSDTSNSGDINVSKSDALGRIPVALQQNRTGVKMATAVTVTNTTETTLVAAGGAGVFNDLTLVACINTSATPVRVDIRDATAGTVRFPLYVPAGDMRGYMNPILIPQTTAANNWTFQASASVTDLRCWAGYITNQ